MMHPTRAGRQLFGRRSMAAVLTRVPGGPVHARCVDEDKAGAVVVIRKSHADALRGYHGARRELAAASQHVQDKRLASVEVAQNGHGEKLAGRVLREAVVGFATTLKGYLPATLVWVPDVKDRVQVQHGGVALDTAVICEILKVQSTHLGGTCSGRQGGEHCGGAASKQHGCDRDGAHASGLMLSTALEQDVDGR